MLCAAEEDASGQANFLKQPVVSNAHPVRNIEGTLGQELSEAVLKAHVKLRPYQCVEATAQLMATVQLAALAIFSRNREGETAPVKASGTNDVRPDVSYSVVSSCVPVLYSSGQVGRL